MTTDTAHPDGPTPELDLDAIEWMANRASVDESGRQEAASPSEVLALVAEVRRLRHQVEELDRIGREQHKLWGRALSDRDRWSEAARVADAGRNALAAERDRLAKTVARVRELTVDPGFPDTPAGQNHCRTISPADLVRAIDGDQP